MEATTVIRKPIVTEKSTWRVFSGKMLHSLRYAATSLVHVCMLHRLHTGGDGTSKE